MGAEAISMRCWCMAVTCENVSEDRGRILDEESRYSSFPRLLRW